MGTGGGKCIGRNNTRVFDIRRKLLAYTAVGTETVALYCVFQSH